MLAAHVLAVIFVSQLIGWVGQTKLTAIAYAIWLRVTHSQLHRQRQDLRREILKTKAEFQSTSSQDEFAKWARLRRKLDKEVISMEQLNNQIGSARTKFSATFSSLVWIFTTGVQFILISYYRSEPVFFLPQGWFPSSVVWTLGLPSAPFGAVSTMAWAMVCRRTLGVGARTLSSLT